MKRDENLIRELMLSLEALPPNRIILFREGDAEIEVDGHSPEEIFYHLGLIKEAGLIHSGGSGRMGSIEFAGLTPAGHVWLDSRRHPELQGGQDTPSQLPTTTMKSTRSQQGIERGIARLQERIDTLKAFDFQVLTLSRTMPELDPLSAAIADTLERCFGKDSTAYRRYKSATALRPVQPKSYSNEFYLRQEAREHFERSVALLQDAQRALREDEEDAEHAAPQPLVPAAPLSRSVFVVHGHDGEARETVARFLKAMDFEPVILHEKPNQGGTVIEKFEANSDVGFAVVLLTPDDLGRSLKEDELKPRARQNVLLELGYFIGRLGRNKVCALKRGDVELPSDYVGVVWEKMDDGGGWKLALARELKAAGHQVDLNKALSL